MEVWALSLSQMLLITHISRSKYTGQTAWAFELTRREMFEVSWGSSTLFRATWTGQMKNRHEALCLIDILSWFLDTIWRLQAQFMSVYSRYFVQKNVLLSKWLLLETALYMTVPAAQQAVWDIGHIQIQIRQQ